METLSENPVDTSVVFQPSSCWYQAATLRERLASVPENGAASTRNEEAEKILQRWKAQKPFDHGSFFDDRLAMDGITEQGLLSLLAESSETLEKRLNSPTAPEWVIELVDALQPGSDAFPLSEQDQQKYSKQFPLFQSFYPLVRKSLSRVLAGVEALLQRYDVLPFEPETILSLLLPDLFQRLDLQLGKTLVLELNIARLRGQLHGETSEARFQDYLHLLTQREHFRPLLEEYVVLARQILMSSRLWAECALEFLQRLCSDWSEILAVFTPDQEPGVLTQVAGGAGDTHRGGHTVMILTFRSEWRLLYKPKSLTIDAHFQELLAWLNARGWQPEFRLLKLLNKATYGWTEYIAVSSCVSQAEVTRFYERQGGYLALLYLLDATDFHYENVLAAGEYPVLIDLEALFHPHPSVPETAQALAQQCLEHSVLHIALLPLRMFLNEEAEGVDISGLSQIEGQLSPRPVPQWEGAGTDEMRLVRKRVELRGSGNLPRLSDQMVQPFDYLEHLITGFTSMYRLLIAHKEEILASVLPNFAHDEIRFVARATAMYSLLLTESFHPNLLRDALKRERFFDRLWLGVEYQPFLARLIPAERADLLQGDIPLFVTYPASQDLWTSRGERLPALFPESSLELVRRRLQQFNEADLQQQVWIIRASFADIAGKREPATIIGPLDQPAPFVSASLNREHLLSHARAIGEHLYVRALQTDGRADWLGLTWLLERDWQLAPAGIDLFSGLPGILLFLSYLGQISGEERYTALARVGLNTLRAVVQDYQRVPFRGGIGAFTGLGSCLYLFSHLSVLWNDAEMLELAEGLVQLLPSLIEKDELFDLVDGVAGCIASLLTLYAVAPSPQVLEVALQCGEHLLSRTQPMPKGLGWKGKLRAVPSAGFAHGNAGIALSLLKLGAVSNQQRFQDVALAALAYERSLFSPEHRNWCDTRERLEASALEHQKQGEPVGTRASGYSMSWSHGAPGIALGRLASLPYLDDAAIRAELETAIETTLAQGFGYNHRQVGPNHSLAHGDCGNLETLLLATQTLCTPQLNERLEHITAQVLESMHKHGWVMGVPLNVETPGLMLGLSGIGHQCLRLAEPDLVPSVLTLAPPPKTAHSATRVNPLCDKNCDMKRMTGSSRSCAYTSTRE